MFYPCSSFKADALNQLSSRQSLLGLLRIRYHPDDPRVLESACWQRAGSEQDELCCMENISSQRCPLPDRPDWLGPASLFPSACQRAGTNHVSDDISKRLPLAAQPATWAWFLPPMSLLQQEGTALVLVRPLVRAVLPWPRALQTSLIAGCSLIKCTQKPEHLQFFSYTALLSCKGTHAIRVYVREAFHTSVSILHPLRFLSPPSEGKREAEISGQSPWSLSPCGCKHCFPCLHKTPKLLSIYLFIQLTFSLHKNTIIISLPHTLQAIPVFCATHSVSLYLCMYVFMHICIYAYKKNCVWPVDQGFSERDWSIWPVTTKCPH